MCKPLLSLIPRVTGMPAMILFIALGLTGCGHKEKAVVDPTVKVDATVIGGGDVQTKGSMSYSGTVESGNETTVSFTVPGTIIATYAKEGQQVSKGQVLGKVRSETLEKSRDMARSQLAQAQDGYNRLKKLHDADALPDVRWVEIQQQLKQAQDAVAIADIAVGDATLKSPITGYVAAKLAETGQSVLPSQPVYRLVSLGDMQLSISVPEEEIGRFAAGTTADITFDALGGMQVRGTMIQRGVEASPFSRTYTVKFDIPNKDGKILPGMIGSATVNFAKTEAAPAPINSYVLPSQAVLLSFDNRHFVWVAKGGKAEQRFVVANELAPNGVTVTSGLNSGDTVITDGIQKLSVGTPLEFVNVKK